MANNVTYQPIQKITLKAAEPIPAFRFVSHLGTICSEGMKSLGTVEKDWLADTFASIITLGTVPIETTTTVNIGDSLTASTDGKAKPAGSSDAVNGRSLEDCIGSGIVKMLLVP